MVSHFPDFFIIFTFARQAMFLGPVKKNAKSDVNWLQSYQQAMIFFKKKMNRINTTFLNCNL